MEGIDDSYLIFHGLSEVEYGYELDILTYLYTRSKCRYSFSVEQFSYYGKLIEDNTGATLIEMVKMVPSQMTPVYLKEVAVYGVFQTEVSMGRGAK